MTSPTNRTDEVAREICLSIYKRDERKCGRCEAIASAIKSAVEAERARCAKVADEYAKYMEASIKKRKPQGLPTMVAECKLDAAKSIVSTIRQTPTKEGV